MTPENFDRFLADLKADRDELPHGSLRADYTAAIEHLTLIIRFHRQDGAQ